MKTSGSDIKIRILDMMGFSVAFGIIACAVTLFYMLETHVV